MIRLKTGTFLLLFLAVVLTTSRTARATESNDSCAGFISSVPAVITTPGNWCLKKDLSTAMASGNAIEIQTDNVTIDCNNFRLDGLAAGPSTATVGIYANNHFNETARHCNVRGFSIGIGFGGTGANHTIEDNRVDGNTQTGLLAFGEGSVVQRNRVRNTGGSPGNGASGIFVADAVDVLDNTVSGVRAATGSNGNAFGISVLSDGFTATIVVGNRVRGLSPDGTGHARGFSATFSQPAIVRSNIFVGNGSIGSIGLSCIDTKGHAKSNVISGFATAVSGCTDDGNVIVP
jgi:hypothetical protein